MCSNLIEPHYPILPLQKMTFLSRSRLPLGRLRSTHLSLVPFTRRCLVAHTSPVEGDGNGNNTPKPPPLNPPPPHPPMETTPPNPTPRWRKRKQHPLVVEIFGGGLWWRFGFVCSSGSRLDFFPRWIACELSEHSESDEGHQSIKVANAPGRCIYRTKSRNESL